MLTDCSDISFPMIASTSTAERDIQSRRINLKSTRDYDGQI